jgi:hypothetical protein
MIWLFLAPGTRVHEGVVEKPGRGTFDLIERARLGYVSAVLQWQFRRNKTRLSHRDIWISYLRRLDASTVRTHQPTPSATVEASSFQAGHSPIVVVLLLIVCRRVSSNNMQN